MNALQGYLGLLYLYWWTLPPWLKVTVWAIVGIGIASLVSLPQPSSRSRRLTACAVLSLYVPMTGISYIWPDYLAQREKWLENACGEALAAQRQPGEQALLVDGFLINVDFERLHNQRYARAARGNESVDLGSYAEHPILRITHETTFSPMAMELLSHKKFSYVEFEMRPLGGGAYSNAGRLNTDGWSKTKYRLYYLAPQGDANCLSFVSAESPALRAVTQSVTGRRDPPGTVSKPSYLLPDEYSPYCLALEINDQSVSEYRITASEGVSYRTGLVKAQEFWLPVIATMHRDLIEVRDERTSMLVRRYDGFDYPNERNPRYSCNDPSAFVDATFQAHPGRKFLRSKAWYTGSAVEAFYEPDMNHTARPAPSRPIGGACPAVPPRPAGGSTRFDQLNDMSRATTGAAVDNARERASFFRLNGAATIGSVQWTGSAPQNSDEKKTFEIRVFRDSDGLPGQEVAKNEVVPQTHPIGRFKGALLYTAKITKLPLSGGDYWLMIGPSTPSAWSFNWAHQPGDFPPDCLSGGAIRHGWKWVEIDPSMPARSSRGFSFRLVAPD